MNQDERHKHRQKVWKDRRDKMKRRDEKETPPSKEELDRFNDAIDRED